MFRICTITGLPLLPIFVHASLGNVICPPYFVFIARGSYYGCQQCYRVLCSCLVDTAADTVSGAVGVVTGTSVADNVAVGVDSHSDFNTQRPATCDGMCRGAKAARRLFRRKMRLLKRKGITPPENAIWWQTKYECTCVVRCIHSITQI